MSIRLCLVVFYTDRKKPKGIMENLRLKIEADSPGELDNLLINESIASGPYLLSKTVKWKSGKHDH